MVLPRSGAVHYGLLPRISLDLGEALAPDLTYVRTDLRDP